MRWRQVDHYHMVSDAGYTVSRAFWDGRVWRYSAWSPDDQQISGYSKRFPRLLGCTDATQDAIDLCEQDKQRLSEKKGTP